MVIKVFEISLGDQSAKLVPINGSAQRQWVRADGTLYDLSMQERLNSYAGMLSLEVEDDNPKQEPTDQSSSIDEVVQDDQPVNESLEVETEILEVEPIEDRGLIPLTDYRKPRPIYEPTFEYVRSSTIQELGREVRNGNNRERVHEVRELIIHAHARSVINLFKQSTGIRAY